MGGDPVNFSDPFGLCPTKEGLLNRLLGRTTPACKSRDEAATKALDAVPTGGWRERCGEIVRADDGYRYTPSRPGDAIRCGIKTGTEGYEGAYHTHPDPRPDTEPEEFSDGDGELADKTEKPVYVKTPSGKIKRKDPDPDKKAKGSEKTIRP
ncbi:MAG: DUF4329 domain-containing protein [Gemmatimonadaceae bacterium]|nr:DUF4329 domain-containing protein [Gemmatimonadaceae bacterium]